MLLPWPALALLTACCESGRDLAVRRLLQRSGWTAARVMGLSCLISAALTLPWLLLAPDGGPSDGTRLLLALAAGGLVNALAFWAYGRALARGDLSLVLPLINLSPLVLLFSGWWLLGERPAPAALAGVALLVLGALLLGRGTGGGLPLLSSPGARSMLVVAVLWGLGAAFDKVGVNAGGSLTWVVLFNLVVAVSLLAPELTGSGGSTARLAAAATSEGLLLLVLLCGLTGAVGMVCQMEALRQTAVVHVIAIKRLSTLMSATVGVTLLDEPRGGLRLPAAALMLAGAIAVLNAAR
ncbi:MAG: hypothetical protein DCF18_13185 [Cyanobium sp.]|uniref:EamA family transporter n=1 Tax=Synechococcus sp. CS-1333 TaxID=2848638 RepID=UPI000DBBD6C3|nr:EamA family transporter [Synechococcus sp. CS-1333]MCT0209292.1 EamA family transporter [Synechococcus sp. CS-1333]PZV20892.1 MAG: hypothetical protein DCF18_13185 [Cyanobium sp.]